MISIPLIAHKNEENNTGSTTSSRSLTSSHISRDTIFYKPLFPPRFPLPSTRIPKQSQTSPLLFQVFGLPAPFSHPSPSSTAPHSLWKLFQNCTGGSKSKLTKPPRAHFSGLKRRGNDFSKCQRQLCARHLLLRVSKQLPPSTGHCTSGYSEPSTSQSVPRAIIPELELVQPRLERGRDSHDPPDTASKESAVKSAFSKGQSVRFLWSQVQG